MTTTTTATTTMMTQEARYNTDDGAATSCSRGGDGRDFAAATSALVGLGRDVGAECNNNIDEGIFSN